MRGSLTWLATALVTVALAAPAHAQKKTEEDLKLVVGEQEIIDGAGVEKYSEGRKGVADMRLSDDGREFVVAALRPGRTSLVLIYESGDQVTYNITVVASLDRDDAVEERENIRLDFYFVELSESYGHQVGIGWPAALGGDQVFRASATIDLQTRALTSATAVVSNQPLPRLDMLQQSGWAKVSRQAAVVTANGNKATFTGGGEVNVQIQGALTAEIRRIEFGSTVKVRPRYDEETGRIELEVDADVADLSDDSGTGIPGRTTSKLKTVVNLQLGQGVMLAGLNSRNASHSKSGLPLLSQIPVLGYFFSSHTSRSAERQTVLFIIPSVVDVVSARARERIGEALNLYSTYEGDLAGQQLIGKPADSDGGSSRRKRSGD